MASLTLQPRGGSRRGQAQPGTQKQKKTQTQTQTLKQKHNQHPNRVQKTTRNNDRATRTTQADWKCYKELLCNLFETYTVEQIRDYMAVELDFVMR